MWHLPYFIIVLKGLWGAEILFDPVTCKCLSQIHLILSFEFDIMLPVVVILFRGAVY